MKAIATLTIGATAILSASAMGQEAAAPKVSESEQEIIITDSTFGDGETRTVRMVVEAPHASGEETSTLCVFVPAGDEAGGALSCPGGNVRVFEFGDGHGRQIIMGDEVIDEQEIRALVEARIAAVNARLADHGAWDVEVVEHFDSEDFRREMEELGREMEQLHQEMRFEFRSREDMSPQERAAFEAEMQEFNNEMREFQEDMTELRAEAMAEVAAEMAQLRERGIPVPPAAPNHAMHWLGDGPHPDVSARQIIHVNRDGNEHVTIIERTEDEDGNPKLTIRTTDPGSVEVLQLDPEELDDDD